MSFESDFLAMSTQQITVESLSTASAYGAPAYSTASSQYTAYVEPGTRMVLTPQGIETIVTATVYVLSSSATVGTQDRVTLPDGRVPKLVRVDTLNDDEGQHHLEIAIA